MQEGVLPDEGISIEVGEESAGRALPQVSAGSAGRYGPPAPLETNAAWGPYL